MIQTVVTKSGNIKGWLVDDFYISQRVLKLFTSDKLKGIKVISRVEKDGVRIRGKKYYSIQKILVSNKDSYRSILRSFIINGISVNSFIFIPCNFKDIEFDKVSSFWKVIFDLPSSVGLHLYMVKNLEYSTSAYLLTRQDIYTSSQIYINMFEVIDKGNGIGKSVIDLLKSSKSNISGLSTHEAENFWKICSAEFTDSLNHFIIQGGI